MQLYKNTPNRTQRFSTKVKNAILLAIFVVISVPTFAQVDPVVQVIEERPTISSVFKSIESQTGFSFSYYDQFFDVTKRVELPKTSTSLSKVMGIILKGTGRNYAISNSAILIKLPQTVVQVPLASSVKPQMERQDIVTQKVEGYVLAMNTSQKLYQATIQAKLGEATYITTSDNQGQFVFDKLPIGLYNFTVSHPDYGSIEMGLYVTNVQSDRLVFVLQQIASQTDDLVENTNEIIPQPVDLEAYMQGVNPGKRSVTPRWAIKTNLLAAATATISLGTEIRIGKKLTLDLPFYYNEWTFKNNKQWRHFLVQPELRFWGHEAFNRHFIGVNLTYAMYNIGGVDLPFNIWKDLKDHRYEGHLFGGGVSVGHHWILSNRFNLEANFGVGYLYTDYTKKQCATCGSFVEKGSKHYFGPTKAAISLIFMIK